MSSEVFDTQAANFADSMQTITTQLGKAKQIHGRMRFPFFFTKNFY